MNETLRVNGYGKISADTALLESMQLNGKPPKSALIVYVKEAYLHCAKSLMRSILWDINSMSRAKNMQSGPTILATHAGADPEEYNVYYERTMGEMIEDEGRE